MTTPPQKLGAHDGGSKSVREHEELIEADGKFFSGDVIGVRPECGMSPREIDRCRAGAAPSTEFRDPSIENGLFGEVGDERIRRKIREASRAGETSNIGHELDVVHGEQSAKLRARTRGVTNRPNGEGHVEH